MAKKSKLIDKLESLLVETDITELKTKLNQIVLELFISQSKKRNQIIKYKVEQKNKMEQLQRTNDILIDRLHNENNGKTTK
jgi:hypothetical protein